MRTAVAICVLLGAVGLLPALSFAQSGSTGMLTAAQTLCASPGESAASPEPSPEPAPAAHPSPRRGIGAGVKVSSLGVGAELAVAVTRRTNLRAGVNAFSYSHGFSNDGISYAGSLRLQSAEAHYDWYPLGGIHFSPGLIAYNRNKLTATASVPGGSTLTLDGVQYMSDPSNPVSGNGKIELNKVAPTFMLGLGNLVRRRGRRFSVNFEVGAAYVGPPQATLNLGGGVCTTSGLNCRTIASDSTVQANVAAEQSKINHNISLLRFYPLISLGFGYRFW